MEILTKEEFELEKNDILERIRDGAIFIHPTDTIYGIGCSALDENAVKMVREIKGRVSNPFSIIAPSKKWIYDNLEINDSVKEWVEKLPGPLTLILKRNDGKLAEGVAPGLNTLGVRIPNHWFSSLIKELGSPIITTSANKVNENFMTSLDNIDAVIKEKVDFIIYEGEKHGKPSKLVDLTKEVEIIER
jgi:L-threonylcarbamoyladenylate synthase|tara:strand:- start:936 stop:1502 length:567 start_codon:yes stop_codon:yes gene_type:complete